MKNRLFLPTLILAISLGISGCSTVQNPGQTGRDRLFNIGWKFIRDSLPKGDGANLITADQPEFDDETWQIVDLPHDWSIHALPGPENKNQIGPFSKKSPGKTATGYTIGGTGWYRKHFTISRADAGKTVVLLFDGAYMEATVWVNGKKAGNHVYGYTPFWFDITGFLNAPGKENVIAVKVENTGRNSRWYSGSGIYRNVHLRVTNPVHIAPWGVQVITNAVNPRSATVDFHVTIQNDGKQEARVLLNISLAGEHSAAIGKAETDATIPVGDSVVLTRSIIIERPALWSVDTPKLYKATLTVVKDGKPVDSLTQMLGIRTLSVSADKGLMINGRPVELMGGCMHHDDGLLGSAAIDRAEERRVELMKAAGFNAIRTSHNPPSETFLNACDRLGMMVIDETFDMWEQPKNPQDYHRFFPTWWKKDVKSMILRDRNHPSIIFWSIGNEIPERADTSGLRIARSLISYIRTMDTTRFFTNAICAFWDHPGTPWDKTAQAFQLLTVGGYNYQWQQYEPDHKKFPQRIMMGTESVPMEAYENWQQVKDHAWVIGDFVWTGMDYLGETGIGHTRYLNPADQDTFAMTWPWFNAWCGDIDLIGDKKPQLLYKEVVWGNSLLEMNVHAPVPNGKVEKVSYWGWPDEYPSWNWKGDEGKVLHVSVYGGGTSVRLELNGKLIGERPTSPATKMQAGFDVPYAPGTLKAIAFRDGREIAVKTLETTGPAVTVKLIADRNPIRADRNDLDYITVQLVDASGQVVTDDDRTVKLILSGDGELAGSGNACPYDMESFGKTVIRTYRGKALAIVRPFAKQGTFTLQAESEGLIPGHLPITVQ